MAEVALSSEAGGQYDELPRPIKKRMQKVFDRLKNWPKVSGAKALSGDLVGHFRMRTSDYRLRFHLKGGKVMIDKIGHRKDFYED